MINMKKSWRVPLLIGLALLAWGCSDESNMTNSPSNEITDLERDDVADDFASTLAGPSEGMLGFWMNGTMGGADGLRAPGDGALDDTVIFDRGGFHVVLVRNYYDAGGTWFPVYDSLTSVRMDRLMWINGTYTNQSGRRTVTIDHFDSTAVYGIEPLSEMFTLQGTGERTVDSEFASRFHQNVKTLHAVYSWTITDLVIARDRELHPYPMSGSIAVDAVVTRTHDNPGRNFGQTVETSMVVYFDGTQWAHIVFVDGREYWIDLTEGWCYRDRP